MKYFLFIFLFFLIFIPSVLGATPSIPENFEVNISDNTANISWDTSTDTDNDSIVYNWVLVNSSGYENITHTVRNESMILYTHFNDGTSTDWSLYGNNGTDTNISYVSEDKYGYAAQFNGIDSYINCGNDSTLDITDNITIEVCVNSSLVTAQHLFSKMDWVGGYRLGVKAWQTSGGFLSFAYGDGLSSSVITSNSVLGSWQMYHLAFIVGDYETIYINGEVDKQEPKGNLNYTTRNFYIGCNEIASSNFIHATIDDVRIYNRTLSPVEINANSNIIAESASYDNFTGIISNLSYGDYHIIVNARDNSTYSEWSEVYNFSITPPPGAFKATFKIIDQYRSDLVYNTYINGTYIADFNITDAYFINTTNDTSITLTASKNYLDISNVKNVRHFITGLLGFVLFAAFLYMAFKIGGR